MRIIFSKSPVLLWATAILAAFLLQSCNANRRDYDKKQTGDKFNSLRIYITSFVRQHPEIKTITSIAVLSGENEVASSRDCSFSVQSNGRMVPVRLNAWAVKEIDSSSCVLVMTVKIDGFDGEAVVAFNLYSKNCEWVDRSSSPSIEFPSTQEAK